MIDFLLEIALVIPEFFKYPGNLILHYVFHRDVHLGEDSFPAYALGIGVWLLVIVVVTEAFFLSRSFVF